MNLERTVLAERDNLNVGTAALIGVGTAVGATLASPYVLAGGALGGILAYLAAESGGK